jgi:hypothetical protein
MKFLFFINQRAFSYSIAGLFVFVSLLLQPLHAQKPQPTSIDTSWEAYYDSVHTIENMSDLPMNQKADDHVIYSLEGLSVTEFSALESASCTDRYNLVFGANMIFYNTFIYEAISSGNMEQAAKKSRLFWAGQNITHAAWCRCISSKYGYSSHLCEDE